MNYRNKQTGVTAIGWLIILGLIAFFTLLILKLVPIYIDNYSVKSILNGLKNEPAITKKSSTEIRTLIQKRLDVNNVRIISAKDFDIELKASVLNVSVKYDEQKNILGNIDVLVRFENSVKVVAN